MSVLFRPTMKRVGESMKQLFDKWFPPLEEDQVALYPGGRFASIAMWLTIIADIFGFLVFSLIMLRWLSGYY